MSSAQPRLAQASVHDDSAAKGAWDWPRTFVARGNQALQVAHLQRKPSPPQVTALHCIVLDCSASMLQSGALAEAKGVLLALLEEIYQQRAHAALLCFGGQGVQLRLPPQRPPAWNDAWIEPIGGGGHSPLAEAVAQADQLLHQASRYPQTERSLWLFSDGRTPQAPQWPSNAARLQLVDCERSRIPLARMAHWAQQWQSQSSGVSGVEPDVCQYWHLDRIGPSAQTTAADVTTVT